MIRLRVIVAVAALMLGATGCTAGPAQTPQPEATQDSTPTQTPQPGPPAVIEITADGFRVLDAEGTELGSQTLGDDAEPAVASLTAAIGTEPTVRTDTLDTGCVAGTSYTWDDAIILFVFAPPPRDVLPQSQLTVRAADVGSVAIRTDAGFAVGDDGREIAAGLPSDQVSEEVGSFVWAKSGEIDAGGTMLPYGGVAFTDYESGLVTFLLTPGTALSGFC